MRIWRALKSAGVGILRDGAYVLPQNPAHQAIFDKQAQQARALSGSAYIFNHSSDSKTVDDDDIRTLFDRTSEYASWNERVATFNNRFRKMDEPAARREEALLRRDLDAIVNIDFFGGRHKTDYIRAMQDLSSRLNQHFSPHEPTGASGEIEIRKKSEFRKRIWATRANLWVDRVASAWLIKRHIDAGAKFLSLAKPAACPADAVGFDFDGAAFSHIDRLVTFEVLVESFQLHSDIALSRTGEMVHYLDVGGISVAESAGFLALISGAKNRSTDDDIFARLAYGLLDNLYAAYSAPSATKSGPITPTALTSKGTRYRLKMRFHSVSH